MNMRRVLFAVLLIAAGAFGSVSAQTCVNSAQPVAVSYPTGGSISISYQICYPSLTNFTSFYWSSTMTYNNVSFDGSYRINGSLGMRLNWANNAIGSVVFTGGPLTYTFGATPYTVSFNNLTFNFNSAFQPTTSTGSLTINGQTVAADNAYWGFLFH